MQLTIPITYSLTLHPRKPKADGEPVKHLTKEVGSYEAFEIPVIDEIDAPIAIHWERGKSQIDSVHAIRWHNDCHWQPATALDLDNMQRMVHIPADRLHEQDSKTHIWSALLEYYESPIFRVLGDQPIINYKEGRIPDASTVPVNRIMHNGREREIEEIQSTLSESVIVVDGMVWTKVPEPVYRPHLDRRGQVDGKITPQMYAATTNFRIDRYDDFVGFLERSYPGLQVTLPPRAEILIPEAINYRDEELSLIEHCRVAIDSGFQHIRNVSHEDSKSWFSLRDLYLSASSYDDLDDLADALRRFGEECVEDNLSAYVERSLERWDMRPIDGGLNLKF